MKSLPVNVPTKPGRPEERLAASPVTSKAKRPETSDKDSPVSVPAGEHPLPPRLLSLDAYRGLIMIALAFNGFGLATVARKYLESNPDSSFWQIIQYQFSHVEWVGCAFWDLIQPSFMFMVGVSLPYSYATRAARGDGWLRMFGHAVWRSVVLVVLGIFLVSSNQPGTNWTFTNVLSQIGLGYAFLFLLWRTPWIVQALAAVLILAGTWYAYISFPNAGMDVTKGAPGVGVTADWSKQHQAEKNEDGTYQVTVPPPWQKNANRGHHADLTILNWLPPKKQFDTDAPPNSDGTKPVIAKPFTFNSGGYTTLNFVPSLATMIFGMLAGQLLRSGQEPRRKLIILLIAGLVALAIGQGMHMAGISMVKRIWTPSFAVFSTGWCLLILAGLYAVIDLAQFRRWAFPLVVVGMNSIAIYVMGQLLVPWTAGMYQTHFGADVFKFLGVNWETFVRSTLVGLFFWLICWWMYRQRIFVRI